MNDATFIRKHGLALHTDICKTLRETGREETLSRILYEYSPLVAKMKRKDLLREIREEPFRSQRVHMHDEQVNRIKHQYMPLDIEEGCITCPKCKGKRVLRTQAQTRSGDESMTTFFRCANITKGCNFKWRVN